AELPRDAAPPGPDGAIVLDRQAVEVASGYGDHATQPGDLDRNQARSKGAVTDLSKVIQAPGPDCTIVLERQAVLLAGRDRGETAQTGDLYGDPTVDDSSIAHLAVRIEAPSPHGPIALDRQTVVASLDGPCDGDRAREATRRRDGRRGVAVEKRPVT